MRKFFLFGFIVITTALFFYIFVQKGEDLSVKGVRDAINDIKVVNTWFPKGENNVNADLVNIGASSAMLVNYDSGEVVYAKEADKRLPAASTIKIMTALIALEKGNLNNFYVVSENASSVGEDSMGLSHGEKLSLVDLLYGLMLPSANDAAVSVAEGIAGSEDAFVAMMNLKSKELGLLNTKFINATGLDVDGEAQFTTAYDLATLARYTWEKYPQFRNIVSTDHIFLEGTPLHKAFDLYNDTNLLTTYPGVGGIKPGFTWEAGYCLVTYAENGGIKLIGVLLNSPDRRGEMARLLDFGFEKYGIKVEHPEVL